MTTAQDQPELAVVRVAPEPALPEAGVLRQLLRKPLALVALSFLGVVVIATVFASLLPLRPPGTAFYPHLSSGPSWAFPLGTDDLGRDILSRLVFGARHTLLGDVQAVVPYLLIGVPLGLTAGFIGGIFDNVVMWIADLFFSTPNIVVVLALLALIGHNQAGAMVTAGVLASMGLMRIVRGATIAVKQEQYVAAARVAGLSWGRIIVRHVLPRSAGPIIVQASLFACAALLFETGLEFLGLLASPSTPSWGGMIAEASEFIIPDPWMIVPPGLLISLTIIALGVLGDQVRDVYAGRWSSGTAQVRTRQTRGERVSGVPPLEEGRLEAADSEPGDSELLLTVRDVSVGLRGTDTLLTEHVSFSLRSGQTVGLVGESGCGKTITVSTLMGLLPGAAERRSGEIYLDGEPLHRFGEKQFRGIRGSEIGLIAQEPVASLDPNFTAGAQVAEVVRLHRRVSRREAREIAVELLSRVKLPDAEKVYRRHLHELSGGMAQRVAIAAALAGLPKLLIADEPLTALDVTTQAGILQLLRDLQKELGLSIILTSHDLGVVAEICDTIVVMYAGEVVERGRTSEVFARPRHPYTAGLLGSDPHSVPRSGRLRAIPGTVPEVGHWPTGCRFAPRCPYATQACLDGPIAEIEIGGQRSVRCIEHEHLDLGASGWDAKVAARAGVN